MQVANKRSDNFFAELLLKRLALGPPAATGDLAGAVTSVPASTARGAGVAMSYARRLGVRARLADGSGLSRANRSAPREVVELLEAVRRGPESAAFLDSLAVAGRDACGR